MLDKIDFMMRFWDLQARHGALGEPLTAAERLELLSLIRMLATDHPLLEAGPAPRTEQSVPIHFTTPVGFLAGELRMVCAGGIVVACSAPLRAGQSTIVRLADAVSGLEYTLPCVVAWGFAISKPAAMALRVDGAPTRHDFAATSSGTWPTALRMSWTDAPWARVG